jgi:hypothetical protein
MRRLLLIPLVAAAVAAGCGAGDTLAEACSEHGGAPAEGFELVRDAHEHAGESAENAGYEARCADGGEAEIKGDNATAESQGWVVD